MVYQLKYDSAQGRYEGKIETSEDGKFLIVDGQKIAINQELTDIINLLLILFMHEIAYNRKQTHNQK